MITKASGTHLNISYEDVQDTYPKDCLNTFGEKKPVQILAQRIWFCVVKWLYFGETAKWKQLEKKTIFETQVSENTFQKNDTSTLVFKCYYLYLLYFKNIVFKIQC